VGNFNRLYFVFVGCFAVWVGLWGYGFPADVARALPWPVPPLHSRFIGAMYLSGALLMFSAAMQVGRRNLRIPLVMAAVWTGMLLLASLFHLGEFDPANPRVWFWFAAYIVYPVVGAWLAWQLPNDPKQEAPTVAHLLLLVQGVVCLALSAALFFAPATMAAYWPWAIPELLAQIYAGPFLSFAIGSLLLARGATRNEMQLPVLAMIVFTVLVLAASLMHRAVLGDFGLSDGLWYGGFGAALLLHIYLLSRPQRRTP
jgi:hypothetical protein